MSSRKAKEDKKNNMNLKIRGNNFYIEYEGKANASLVKELRKIIEIVTSEMSYIDAYFDEDEEINYSLMEISPDLKKKQDFRKTVRELLYSEEQHIIRKVALNNTITIKVDKDKKTVKASLNENEWKKEINRVLSEINLENVNQCILHIITSLNQQDIDFIFDTVRKYMYLKPVKTFITKKDSLNTTTLECILFGSRLIKESEDE